MLYSLFMVQFQSSLIHYSVNHFGHGRLVENLALCIAIGLGSILNYFCYSRIIWKNKDAGENQSLL
jgi:dolichol-phosphate mannosyltransferase